MARVCDWTELEDGDAFEVPEPSPTWTSHAGSRYKYFMLRAGTIYPFQLGVEKGKEANHLPRIVYHPTNSSYSYFGYRKFSQEVRVIDIRDLNMSEQFQGLSQRVNSLTGSDPEIFVVRGRERKTLLPAFQFLPKQEEVKGLYAKAAHGGWPGEYVYRDGFAAEAFIAPGSCHGYMINHLQLALRDVRKKAQAYDRTAELTIKNHFVVPATTMDTAADEDVAFGCKPSMNAYDDAPVLPDDPRAFRSRFAGGHVHLGIGRLSEDQAVRIVKACDVVAAIPAVAIFASLDVPIRRMHYGRAGEYRKPAHGLEYRVLSNAWLSTPEIAHLTLNLVRCAAKVGKADLLSAFDLKEEAARDIINFCDVKTARKFVSSHYSLFHALLQAEGLPRDKAAEKAFEAVIEGGVEARLPDFQDLTKNWLLDGGWNGESNNMTATWSHLCRRPVKV